MNPSTEWMQWGCIHISWAKSTSSELPKFLNKIHGELLLKYIFIFNKHTAMKKKKKSFAKYPISSIQFSSVTLSCSTLCDPMNRSTPGLPVHHQLPESTQTHVHQVGDAIQPSHPLWSPSAPALNLSQHQGLFKWISSSHQVVLEFQLQHQSFQWTPRTDLL